MNPIVLANLLSILLPLGAQVYNEIQQAHSTELKPVEEILAKADINWDNFTAVAQAELAKLKQPK